jgi:probable selenium-dependent hydroxylase accessory protein YqeC
MTEALLDALAARNGIVCAVGAGGKKTTLNALALAHPGRVGLTATVFTAMFPRRLEAEAVVSDTPDLAARVAGAAGRARRVAWARPSEKSGRVAGIEPGEVAECHAAGGFEVTLVKADGARMRGIKAPNPDEPRIPPAATTVLPIVSAAVIGAALDETIAHRPERVAAVTGLARGDAITPEAVGRLLASPEGALQHVPRGAVVVPVINAVDDTARAERARRAARTALACSDRFERVVLTRHARDGAPWLERVRRDR